MRIYNPSKLAKHICNLINKEFNLSFDTSQARICSNGRMAWHYKADGTFQWNLYIGDCRTEFGSTQKAIVFKKCKKIDGIKSIFHTEIFTHD